MVGKFKLEAIPHNFKCRYGERGAAAAKQKAQIILCAAKVSAAGGGYSEPKQGQRSQSARGFCPRSTMRVPQPDIIEHFGNADAVPHTEPQRGASERNRRLRRLLARRSAGAVLKPLGGNCAVLPYAYSPYNTAQRASTSRAGRAAAMARAASSFSSVVKSPSSGKCCKIFCSRSS